MCQYHAPSIIILVSVLYISTPAIGYKIPPNALGCDRLRKLGKKTKKSLGYLSIILVPIIPTYLSHGLCYWHCAVHHPWMLVVYAC